MSERSAGATSEATEKNSFVFYESYWKAVAALPKKQQLPLLAAIITKSLYDEDSVLDGVSEGMFSLILPQIQANNRRYENGKKGGAPTGNNNAKKQPRINLETTKKQANVDKECRLKMSMNNGDKECVDLNSPDEEEQSQNVPFAKIMEMFNSTCPSFASIRSIDGKRKDAVRARFGKFGIEGFEEVFKACEASDFMKGDNDRNWTADFDWIVTESNFPKVLEGKYANKKPPAPKPTQSGSNWDNSALLEKILNGEATHGQEGA